MPHKTDSSNPPDLFSSKKIKTMIESLAKQYDYIIIDSPPVLAVHDAVDLGTQVHGALWVVSDGNVRRKELNRTAKRLEEVNVNIIGVRLNRIDSKTEGYYYSYYKNYYSSKTESSPSRKNRQEKITSTPQQ